ncbi:hypothetical protein [Bradyrhizobium sp. SZCCHNS3002]|uniref:hypothetical protein n=1 Tax=Bradyrhizobium sp. SZCCHNS3002 TaxID=3057310 RepID=UPI0028E45BD2|nr:hypothetical protein [Bradyrhizobium sp. SZCCHNS3002]
MAKALKKTGLIAQGVIEHGAVVDGKNVVQRFEPGEDVSIDDEGAVEAMLKSGALKKGLVPADMISETDTAELERQRKRDDAAKVYDASSKLKLQFATLDDYIAALDAAK